MPRTVKSDKTKVLETLAKALDQVRDVRDPDESYERCFSNDNITIAIDQDTLIIDFDSTKGPLLVSFVGCIPSNTKVPTRFTRVRIADEITNKRLGEDSVGGKKVWRKIAQMRHELAKMVILTVKDPSAEEEDEIEESAVDEFVRMKYGL